MPNRSTPQQIFHTLTTAGLPTYTTTALAHGLALAGHIVHATDFDRQGHLAITLGLPPAPGVFNHLVSRASLQSQFIATGRPNLSILPGNSHTEEANTVLRTIHAINDVPGMVRQIATGAEGKTIWEYKHPGIHDVQQAYQFLIDWITTEGN